MAVGNPRDIPVTREQVWEWLQEYDGQLKETIKLRTFLMGKVEALELEDPMLDTSRREDIEGDEAHVVDMILGDIESYGFVRD
jgi:hypothetical protein